MDVLRDIDNVKRTINDQQRVISGRDAEIEHLNSRIATMHANMLANMDVGLLESANHKLSAEIDRLHAVIDNRTEQLNRSNIKIKSLMDESGYIRLNEFLEYERKRLNSEILKKDAEISGMSDEIKRLTGVVETFDLQNSGISYALAQRDSEIEQLRKSIINYSNAAIEYVDEIESLRDDKAANEIKIGQLTSDRALLHKLVVDSLNRVAP